MVDDGCDDGVNAVSMSHCCFMLRQPFRFSKLYPSKSSKVNVVFAPVQDAGKRWFAISLSDEKDFC